MPPRGSRKAVADIAVEEENDENLPPQGRRSQRTKARRSASMTDLGLSQSHSAC